MINDYSEVMSTMPEKVSALYKALSDKKYPEARLISNQIIDGMEDIWQWSINKESVEGQSARTEGSTPTLIGETSERNEY